MYKRPVNKKKNYILKRKKSNLYQEKKKQNVNMPGEFKFYQILDVFSKPETDEDLKPLACGHICQIPNVVRDKCCQCSDAKRQCNYCRGGEHKHTLQQERTYCNKHDVPVGRDKNGICCICHYKDHVTSSGSNTLKLYKKSPWLKRQADLKKEKEESNALWRQWSKKQKRIMWRERYPMCKCHFVHICKQIKKFPNPYDWGKTNHIHMEWNSDKGYRCPYGNNPCRHHVVKKKQPSKPAINTLQTIDEFAHLAEEQDVWSENRKTNDDVESQERKTKSDTKLCVEEFSRDGITWPSLGDIDTGDRSLRDWVVFQNGEISNSDHDDDIVDNSDAFSLISEPFSECSWVDLTPATTTTKKEPKKQLSFAEMLKRKSKNNFTNQLKAVIKTNFATAKDVHSNSKLEDVLEENAIEIEKLKGAHRNHATKNSRKGFVAYKKWNGRRGVKSKRSKNSVRRRCK